MWSGIVVILHEAFLVVEDVGKTDDGMDLASEYMEGTGCRSHLNVLRWPAFKNLACKCLEHISPCFGRAQSLRFTNLIHFLFKSGFSPEKIKLEIFQQ